MKLLAAGGGTSGHINPALAIVREFVKRHPDTEVLFIGTEGHAEADLVPRAGFNIKFIEISGLSRQKSFSAVKHNIKTAFKYLKAKERVKQIIKEFKPDIVLGTGGYVSAPVVRQAAKMGIKTVIHEQNAYAGVSTKMLAPVVDKVFLSFPLAKPIKCDASKTEVVGNPVNPDFLGIDRESARIELGIPDGRPFVLSYGGSLGARKINDAFAEMAAVSAEEGLILHYHGAARDYDYLNQKLGTVAQADNIKLFKYIYNMPTVMAAADLIIARSGAMTLTEIAALGRASILIPSPNVTENHQYYNAKGYSDVGAAILIEEVDLSGEKLYQTVKTLMDDRAELRKMEKAALGLARTDAAARICDQMETLLGI